MADLLSSGKTEPQTRHDLCDTYSRRAADADTTVDERCGVVCFASTCVYQNQEYVSTQFSIFPFREGQRFLGWILVEKVEHTDKFQTALKLIS